MFFSQPIGVFLIKMMKKQGVYIDPVLSFYSTFTILYISLFEEHVEYYISKEMKKMDAIKAVAKDRGVSKSEIYKIVNVE